MDRAIILSSLHFYNKNMKNILKRNDYPDYFIQKYIEIEYIAY